uniref:Head-tail connector protein n=1 Tax=uncultured marine virus TaxID=186617 RepID=A0A0F7L9M3_9VIRU|nr:head-tail connector protein [uncultured marine virus]
MDCLHQCLVVQFYLLYPIYKNLIHPVQFLQEARSHHQELIVVGLLVSVQL